MIIIDMLFVVTGYQWRVSSECLGDMARRNYDKYGETLYATLATIILTLIALLPMKAF